MFKKVLSAVLSAATVIGTIPYIPAKAEEPELYPYTLFAGSSEDGAITINSDNVCINGSIATNGTVSTTAQNFNVNGTRAENAQEEMQLFFNKIDSRYFSLYVETYFEDYFLEDSVKADELIQIASVDSTKFYDFNTQKTKFLKI